MVDVSVLPGFVGVILLVLIPPGPDMAYMIAVGLDGGRRTALRAIVGIGTGMSVYGAAVVLGVGRLAQTYPLVLDIVKILGAAYLLWLSYVTISQARRSRVRPRDVPTGRPYLRGLMVSLTNPKVILFFLAVLPQFVGRAHDIDRQLAMLGAITVLLEVLLYGTIGVLAGAFGSRFHSSQNARNVLHYIAGGVYIVLAVVVSTEVVTKVIAA